jgi:hypothetical protein
MTLMQNPFEGRPEIIFMCYEDVIKSPYPFLLNEINTKLSQYYESFLDLDKIKGKDLFNLSRLCVQRSKPNILEYLAKTEFDYVKALKDLKDRYFKVYADSELLAMGKNMDILLAQKFTKKIYLYTEIYDIRIHLDIQETFKDMQRVTYVTGSFKNVINKIEGITSYILNDLDYAYQIIKEGKEEYTDIMVANYGYNYFVDDDSQELELRLNMQSLIKDSICKFGTFTPLAMDERHFTQI